MTEPASQILSGVVRQLLRPLVRILLRHGVPLQTFAEYAKQAYVDVAASEFAVPGRKASISRISVITGLTRKEVSRLLREEPAPSALVERTNRAARVISAWVRDPDFHDRAGRPRSLDTEGPGGFAELVRKSSGDVPPRAMLDELLQVGAVTPTRNGRHKLLTRAYVPRDAEANRLLLLGNEVADLTASIDHNLTHPADEAFFQRAVRYDNLTSQSLPKLREMTSQRGQSLLEKLDQFMSKHDRDSNPEVTGSGRARAVVGVYYYEEPMKEES